MRFIKSPKANSQKSPKDPRLSVLKGFFVTLALGIIVKLFFLQIVDARFYMALASDQHEIYKTLFPQRGSIFVKEVNSLSEKEVLYPLATNRDFKTVYAQPKFISDPQKVADILSPILEIPPEELLLKLDKPNDPYEVLKRKINDDIYRQISDLNIKGIKFQNETYRYYPEHEIGSQVLGFVGLVDNKKVGQYGLEGYFEKELAGKQGAVRSEADLSGRWISSTSKYYQPAVDGVDLVLTIDKTIEYEVCKTLTQEAERFQAQSATAVVMEPFSGKILAMCSYPDFDPNVYNKVEDIRAYNNTAIFEAYEPGSIFKPITMAAALDLGIVEPSTTYIDTGEVKVDKYTIRNADLKAHGKVDMVEVLNQSLNTGMIYVIQKLGTADFKRYVQNFGFGQKTGVRLDTEVAGNISSLDKKSDIYAYTASFGQGITVTPLQMVQAFSAIANGGYLVRPYIVEEIRGDNFVTKTEPKVIKKILDEKTTTLLSSMLVSVVKNGHGKAADVPGYNIAGKTGTAQIPDFERGGYSSKTNHSFIGYGPVDNPEFVMLIKYEDPKVGGFSASTAAPTFGKLAKFILNYLKVPPDLEK